MEVEVREEWRDYVERQEWSSQVKSFRGRTIEIGSWASRECLVSRRVKGEVEDEGDLVVMMSDSPVAPLAYRSETLGESLWIV